MCDGYSDCGDDYEDDEEFPEPPAPQPVECPFGCGSAFSKRSWADSQLEGSTLVLRHWAELPCGHEGGKRITEIPLGPMPPILGPGETGIAARPTIMREVRDLTPWTDPERAPTKVRNSYSGRLFNWLNNWLRR